MIALAPECPRRRCHRAGDDPGAARLRLDQLEPAERTVLECGAVVGRVFHNGALQALVPEHVHAQLGAVLAALVRKDLSVLIPIGWVWTTTPTGSVTR